ncbi:peptidoglycan-binding domain-containing protein [Cellulosimicrobium funkei]|uniref:peptidoglycan-binding domain-containing protein n=1 Tax=Cellulosimicrobium funkei TaxID=264251 RepID=UPI000B280127|nr:peptidoglycan-binding domain-containing protein [Cellulosimicrobium funkei]
MRSDRSRGWVRLVPLVALWAVPVVAVAVAFPLVDAAEERSVAVPAPTVVEVGARSDDGRTAVEVATVRAVAPEVRAPAGGVVTALAEAGPVEVGQALFALDGVDVLVYRGSPLWRDLRSGDRGTDVRALGDYLVSLGYLDADRVDDRFGPATREAVRALQERLGVSRDGEFHLSYVVRVDDAVPAVTGPLVGLGDRVEAGDAVLEGSQPVEALTVAPIAEGGGLGRLAREPVVLRLGEVEVPMSSAAPQGAELDGVVAALEEAAAAGTLERIVDEATSTVRYRGAILALQDPAERGAVPSTAVRVDHDGTTCVLLSDGSTAAAQPRRLEVAEPGNELATVLVDADLVGSRVLRDATQATGTSGCG